MLKTLTLLSLFVTVQIYSQLKLEVKVLDYEQNASIVPRNLETLGSEKSYKGYVLECTVVNTSDQMVSFPLDISSYAIPFTQDIRDHVQEENQSSNPDLLHHLGVWGFVSQNGNTFEGDITSGMTDSVALPDEDKMIRDRENIIKEWGIENNIQNERAKVLNWYMIKNIRVLKPKERLSYKIYFNPFFKKMCRYCYQEFYYGLTSKSSYEVNFKIILDQNQYKVLTQKQKRKYKNLVTGVTISNTLSLDDL